MKSRIWEPPFIHTNTKNKHKQKFVLVSTKVCVHTHAHRNISSKYEVSGPGASFHTAINYEFQAGWPGPLDNGGIKSVPLKRDINPDKAQEI